MFSKRPTNPVQPPRSALASLPQLRKAVKYHLAVIDESERQLASVQRQLQEQREELRGIIDLLLDLDGKLPLLEHDTPDSIV